MIVKSIENCIRYVYIQFSFEIETRVEVFDLMGTKHFDYRSRNMLQAKAFVQRRS